MIEEIKQLAQRREALATQALEQYQPIVQKYILNNCSDSQTICYTLDYMLDFCFDERMLQRYRQLCS